MLDFQLRSLHRGTERIRLTPKSFKTLEFLVKNRNRVVSKAELLEQVWGGQREISTVEHAISNLRRAFGDDPAEARFIATVLGEGYRFIASVEGPSPATGLDVHRTESQPADDADCDEANAHSIVRAEEKDRKNKHRLVWRNFCFAIATSVVLILVMRGGNRFRGSRVPERVTISGATLSAWDSHGQLLWDHHFDQPTRVLSAEEQAWRIRLTDLDGDGRPEVLVALAFPQTEQYDKQELFCFSSTGQLRWRYAADHTLRFVSRSFNGPWKFLDMITVPDGKRQIVWLALADEIWWPSILVTIEADGHERTRFVSSGLIRALNVIKNANGTFILAGGVNNEYAKASLAVLRAEQAPATSPQTIGQDYQCLECPAGLPYQYFLFPRSELNVAMGMPYNTVRSIDERNRHILLDSVEGTEGYNARAWLELSADLVPERVLRGDGYKETHQLLERRGLIGHAWKNCLEEKTAATVQSWDSTHGWREITVPRIR